MRFKNQEILSWFLEPQIFQETAFLISWIKNQSRNPYLDFLNQEPNQETHKEKERREGDLFLDQEPFLDLFLNLEFLISSWIWNQERFLNLELTFLEEA